MTAASTSLPASTASVPHARRFVRTTLEELGALAAWDAAEMLVSEIVTNAVLHARTEFTVGVELRGDTVRVSVSDLSPAVPMQRSYGTDSTTGRGLRLVATLAAAWGVDRTSAGKTVWFDVLAAGDDGTEVQPWDDAADLDVLLAGFGDLDDGPASAPQLHTRWESVAAPLGRVALRRAGAPLGFALALPVAPPLGVAA